MNTIYRIIRNAAGQAVVASELAKGRTKGGALKTLAVALALAGASFTLPAFASEQGVVEAAVAEAVASAESSKDGGAVEVKGVELLAQSFGAQPAMHGMVPVQTVRSISPMATGNGSLRLCASDDSVLGTSLGYGSTGNLDCGAVGKGESFALLNSGNEAGSNAWDNPTAGVVGYKDGRLELMGRSGVTIQGVATLTNGADLADNKITNLAAGTADTDAANVGQLRGVAEAIGAEVDADGNIVAPTYNVQGNTYNNVSEALTSLDTSVTNNTTNITHIQEQLKESGLIGDDGVAIGAVQYNADKSQVVLAGANGTQIKNVADGTDDMDAVNVRQLRSSGLVDENGDMMSAVTYNADKSQVMLAGANGTVIGNVADGRIAIGSKEAVNGGQLAAIRDQLQDQIDNLDDRVGTIETGIEDGTIGKPGDNFDGDAGGQPIGNVGDGVEDTDAANVGQLKEGMKTAVESAKQYTDGKVQEITQALDTFKGDVYNRFERQERKINGIGAMSAANTQMAINAAGVGPGKGRLSMGVGLQSNQKAFAIGYAKTLGERSRFSVGGAISGSQKSAGAGFGIDL
jgi:autotransporter adhesin